MGLHLATDEPHMNRRLPGLMLLRVLLIRAQVHVKFEKANLAALLCLICHTRYKPW